MDFREIVSDVLLVKVTFFLFDCEKVKESWNRIQLRFTVSTCFCFHITCTTSEMFMLTKQFLRNVNKIYFTRNTWHPLTYDQLNCTQIESIDFYNYKFIPEKDHMVLIMA